MCGILLYNDLNTNPAKVSGAGGTTLVRAGEGTKKKFPCAIPTQGKETFFLLLPNRLICRQVIQRSRIDRQKNLTLVNFRDPGDGNKFPLLQQDAFIDHDVSHAMILLVYDQLFDVANVLMVRARYLRTFLQGDSPLGNVLGRSGNVYRLRRI